jgi:hypothetical protein
VIAFILALLTRHGVRVFSGTSGQKFYGGEFRVNKYVSGYRYGILLHWGDKTISFNWKPNRAVE